MEGAGGCLVPLNDQDLLIDLIDLLGAEVIVVSNHYLGSINHTLLTIEALHRRKLRIKGLIFNGDHNPDTEDIILHYAKERCLLRIQKEKEIHAGLVRNYAAQLKSEWNA